MQLIKSDRALRARLAEIRADAKSGSIGRDEAKRLRGAAIAARKAYLAEFEVSEDPQALPEVVTAAPVWVPPVEVSPVKGMTEEQIQAFKTVIPSKERPGTKARQQSVSARKGWRGGAKLPHQTAVLFAAMPSRKVEVTCDRWAVRDGSLLPSQVHATKREVFEGQHCTGDAYARAAELERHGWLCAILRTPEEESIKQAAKLHDISAAMGEWRLAADAAKRVADAVDKGKPFTNAPKTGWSSRHWSVTWRDGAELSAPERAFFGLHDPAAAFRAAKATATDSKDQLPVARAYREGLQCRPHVAYPVPRDPDAVTFTVRLIGPVVTGKATVLVNGELVDQDVCSNEQTLVSRVSATPKDGETGSGPLLTAARLVTDWQTGVGGRMVAKSITYNCPELEREVTLTRDQALQLIGEEPDDGRLAFEDWESLPVDERIKATKGELPLPRERRPVMKGGRPTGKLGQKVQQSRDSWGSYTRSQGL